ncbi:MAG: MMPL family transporter [Candidatus Poribacteria bacterium]
MFILKNKASYGSPLCKGGQGDFYRAALEKTLETAGVAIVINALSVMMGFLVLLMSSLVPLQRFGWLTALTMFTSALGSITVLPALILLTKARFVSTATEETD